MNFSMFTSNISSFMNLDSSIFSSFVCAPGGANGVLNNFLNFVYGLLYTVGKYILYFVDLIFSYIQKLWGLDMSFDSLESLVSPDSYIFFNFLYSSGDLF